MKNGTDDGFFDCVNDNPQSMLSDYFSYVWPTLKARYVWFLTHHTFSRSAIQTVTRYIYSPSPRFCCKHFSLYFWPPTSSCFHLSYHRCFSPPLALPLSSLNRGNLQFFFFLHRAAAAATLVETKWEWTDSQFGDTSAPFPSRQFYCCELRDSHSSTFSDGFLVRSDRFRSFTRHCW